VELTRVAKKVLDRGLDRSPREGEQGVRKQLEGSYHRGDCTGEKIVIGMYEFDIFTISQIDTTIVVPNQPKIALVGKHTNAF
jgi:hypothetical protein